MSFFPVVYAEIQKCYSSERAPWEEVAAKYSTNKTTFSNPCEDDEFVELRAQPVESSLADKKQNIEKWLDNNMSGMMIFVFCSKCILLLL